MMVEKPMKVVHKGNLGSLVLLSAHTLSHPTSSTSLNNMILIFAPPPPLSLLFPLFHDCVLFDFYKISQSKSVTGRE